MYVDVKKKKKQQKTVSSIHDAEPKKKSVAQSRQWKPTASGRALTVWFQKEA